MGKKDSVRDYYDQYAPQYDRFYQPIQSDKFQHLSSFVTVSPLIFDLGGGSGILSEFITGEVVNLDISYQMIREGRSANRSFIGIAADLEYPPFRAKSVDSFISLTAYQNCEDLELALNQLGRILSSVAVGLLTILKKSDKLEEIQTVLKKLNFSSDLIPYSGEDVCLLIHRTQ